MANDQQRKDTFRGLLQESIIRYAEIILALDEMATLMKDDWKIKPDIDKPIQFVSLSSIEATRTVPLPNVDFPSPSTKDQEITEGWITMFDGMTLNGWRISGDPNAWKVQDGTIVCNGERSHLFYVSGGSFKNFHFKCEAKCFSGSNSGVYFHTRFKDQGYPRLGFECQIDNSTDRRKTGSLFGVVDVTDVLVQDGKWFALEIIVKGQLITIKLDGRVVTVYKEPNNQKPSNSDFERLIGDGTFALQSNSPNFGTHFRSIQVKRLED